MKNLFNNIRVFILGAMLTLPVALFAQDDPTPPSFDDDTVDTPIDGGLSILLAAGVAYGVKRGYEKRKKEKQSTDEVEN